MATWWWQPTAALDATRSGGQNYSQAEVKDVLASLQVATWNRPIRVADIALQTGVPGRTVRQIITDVDSRVCLVGKRPNGLLVARFAEEGDALTSMIDHAWRTSRERCARRRAFAKHMDHRQLTMFEMDELLYEDEADDDD